MSTIRYNLGIYEDQIDSDAEVELISLITEQLPHYKLRTDSRVRFSGYKHCDFSRAKQINEDITELTNDQIHQTLEYFILCGLRVSKMTDTYEDCAALTMLVQEQRSHLDLAANIGLNLVDKNVQLEQRVVYLEEQLDASRETIKQISHQLSLKDDLLRMFHSEIEESEDQISSQTEPADPSFCLEKVSVTQLEMKLNRLEEENMVLRHQQQTLTSSTDMLENKEAQLVNDCVSHILESTKTIDRLSNELNKKTNDYLNQHEEISRLLTTKIDLENKTHNLLSENDHLITQLRDHQTKEFTLTKEISDMRDRYDECINLLNEKQDVIRQLKKSLKKESKRQVQYCDWLSPEPDLGHSLAEELEESYRRDAQEMDRSRTMRIMEQARCMNTSWNCGDDETSSGFTDDLYSSVANVEIGVSSVQDNLSGNYLLRRSIQDDCERRRVLRHATRPHESGHFSKISIRPSSGTITPRSSPTELSESRYISEALYHHQNSCHGLSSLNSSIISHNDSTNHMLGVYKYPDKLQLVKPIEGSQTLRAWQNLATPSITKALFEDQPIGVCFRGQQCEVSPSRSSMSDDGDDADHGISCVIDEPLQSVIATKASESHSNTYTFSHSRLSHLSTEASCPSVKCSRPSVVSSLRDIVSTFQSPTHDTPLSTNDDTAATPVNDVHPRSFTAPGCMPAQSSWLDRFTVGAIMTSILGHASRPSLTQTQSGGDEGLIGRLTQLPPLARHHKPQHSPLRQSGLNLLTSLASSSPETGTVYRCTQVD